MQWPLVRNHSDGFVTTCPNTGERVHTNGVEAVNSPVKVEEGHKFRLGKRPECRLNHIAAHAVLVNGRQKKSAKFSISRNTCGHPSCTKRRPGNTDDTVIIIKCIRPFFPAIFFEEIFLCEKTCNIARI